jgi:hypothetical protein
MTVMDEIRLSAGQPAQLRDGIEPSAEAMDMARAEAAAAERERIARRVSERVIVRLSVGRDPLVEVNEIIQDLAHDIATDWDYE